MGGMGAVGRDGKQKSGGGSGWMGGRRKEVEDGDRGGGREGRGGGRVREGG
jgi:hypothetical protein